MMPLGMEVGLDPSDIVLDGDPAARFPKRDRAPAIFSPRLLWPNTCMDQDATLYGLEVGLGPGIIVLDADPATPQGAQPPKFRPMSVLTKLLDGSRSHLVRR